MFGAKTRLIIYKFHDAHRVVPDVWYKYTLPYWQTFSKLWYNRVRGWGTVDVNVPSGSEDDVLASVQSNLCSTLGLSNCDDVSVSFDSNGDVSYTVGSDDASTASSFNDALSASSAQDDLASAVVTPYTVWYWNIHYGDCDGITGLKLSEGTQNFDIRSDPIHKSYHSIPRAWIFNFLSNSRRVMQEKWKKHLEIRSSGECIQTYSQWRKSGIQNSAFSANFSTQEISSNFNKKIEKCWNWCQKNVIFRGMNVIEYLLNLNEKWMMIEVSFCSFDHVLNRFGRVQFPSVSANIRNLEISLNFKKVLKILKFTSEKLYFQRILYARTFVEFTWKIDCEKGQIL